jgi:hypothetical protein
MPVSGAEANKHARTGGWIWQIPYCVACAKHVRRWELLHVMTFGLFAVAILLSVVVSVLGDIFLGLIGGGALLLSLAVGHLFARSRFRFRRLYNCCGFGPAVRYIGANGSCHTFDFRSYFYACEFVFANRRKIVNATPKVIEILKEVRYGDHQVPTRVHRKAPKRW